MCGNFCGGHKFWIKHSWKTQNFKYLAGLGLRKKYCFTKKIHIRRKAQVQLPCDDKCFRFYDLKSNKIHPFPEL